MFACAHWGPTRRSTWDTGGDLFPWGSLVHPPRGRYDGYAARAVGMGRGVGCWETEGNQTGTKNFSCIYKGGPKLYIFLSTTQTNARKVKTRAFTSSYALPFPLFFTPLPSLLSPLAAFWDPLLAPVPYCCCLRSLSTPPLVAHLHAFGLHFLPFQIVGSLGPGPVGGPLRSHGIEYFSAISSSHAKPAAVHQPRCAAWKYSPGN